MTRSARPLVATLMCLAALAACQGSGGGAGSTSPAVSRGSEPHVQPGDVQPGDVVADFEAETLYVDDTDQVMGVRWRHTDHGLPVTVLRIQSVPQVFLHVNTPPVSDRGEPHTGEHLLLGKGRRGKTLASSEGMSLMGSTAYTSQTDVVYAWNCSAGKDTFYRSVDGYLEALLLPDYTDEEVRREVCNVGVTKAKDGTLSLEEKGTIYNEMVSAYEKSWNVWRTMRQRVWGADHPHGFSSGGEPAAVRAMQPEHIHAFHRDHYHLSANLGMLVALPDTVPEREFLERLSARMNELDAHPTLRERPKTIHAIPAARPQADRSVQRVPFPQTNESVGGVAILSWPPRVMDGLEQRILAEVLLGSLGDGETSTLYKLLMDSATREVKLDASALYGWLESTKVDSAAMIALEGLPSARADDATVAKFSGVIATEIARIAALPDGSEELQTFNAKALLVLSDWQKNVRKQLNAPPLFGHRSKGGFWLDHLRLLDLQQGDRRHVTLQPAVESIGAQLAGTKNVWTGLIGALGLSERPYITISVASAAEMKRLEAAKQERLKGYLAQYQKQYEQPDAQKAMAAYLSDYEQASRELAEMEKGLLQPKLVADVPLTSDPSLVLEDLPYLPGQRGIFDNVTSVETTLALDLRGVEPGDLPWLAILPQFLTSAGVVVDGVPLPYDQAEDRRSEEILALSAAYTSRPTRGRHELRLSASGLDAEEAGRAVDWLERSLFDSWVAPENLPRLRDLIQQATRAKRGTLGGREENWVRNPANALRFQNDALYLAHTSHHAQLFSLARLEWLLTEPPTAMDSAVVGTFLSKLPMFMAVHGDTPEVRDAAIEKMLETFSIPERVRSTWLRPILARVRELDGDLALASRRADLEMLAARIGKDLFVTPAEALARFERVRSTLVGNRPGARLVLTGSRANTNALLGRLQKLIARMGEPRGAAAISHAQPQGVVRSRLADHQKVTLDPVHYGLVHGGGRSGVFTFSADAATLDAVDAASLTRELACRVYGGSGPHGFFMQTWGAGLAYSNGLGVSAQSGRVSYYAERCPDLVETMKFVVGVAEGSEKLDDAYLAEYSIANAATRSRASNTYESRTLSAADEIVDGDTPDRVAAWRRAVLDLRGKPELWASMKPHIESTCGRVLPGLGPRSRDVAGGNFLVIAPPKLIDRWEGWVTSHEGAEERVYRIYPRDFWLVPGITGVEMSPSK